MGVDLDLAVEKLNVRGKVYATLTFSMDAPFPHFTHLNVTFVEKPEVWFSVRVLKVNVFNIRYFYVNPLYMKPDGSILKISISRC